MRILRKLEPVRTYCSFSNAVGLRMIWMLTKHAFKDKEKITQVSRAAFTEPRSPTILWIKSEIRTSFLCCGVLQVSKIITDLDINKTSINNIQVQSSQTEYVGMKYSLKWLVCFKKCKYRKFFAFSSLNHYPTGHFNTTTLKLFILACTCLQQ
jgi:hypothetical protein